MIIADDKPGNRSVVGGIGPGCHGLETEGASLERYRCAIAKAVRQNIGRVGVNEGASRVCGDAAEG